MQGRVPEESAWIARAAHARRPSTRASASSTASSYALLGCPAVAQIKGAKPKGPWTAKEIARNERVAQARVARDRRRGPSANLQEGLALTRFANRLAQAFRDARRA